MNILTIVALSCVTVKCHLCGLMGLSLVKWPYAYHYNACALHSIRQELICFKDLYGYSVVFLGDDVNTKEFGGVGGGVSLFFTNCLE